MVEALFEKKKKDIKGENEMEDVVFKKGEYKINPYGMWA
jgi:hypothetical protein